MARRRRRRSNKNKLISIIITLAVVVTITYGKDYGIIPKGLIHEWLDDKSSSIESGKVYCDRVVDGDTIVVLMDGKKEKVRMIGINTPESVHPDKSRNTPMGKIASKYTKDNLEGKYVTLETDVQERDKYCLLYTSICYQRSVQHTTKYSASLCISIRFSLRTCLI